jgi:hypothetical protein
MRSKKYKKYLIKKKDEVQRMHHGFLKSKSLGLDDHLHLVNLQSIPHEYDAHENFQLGDSDVGSSLAK